MNAEVARVAAGGLHLAWARIFVRTLVASGVRRAVVSPGSRSTPLVLAIAEEKSLTTDVIVDERSAAFFALAQARASGEPSLLVCTSGTAGAHYLPAIIEASESFVPLVVVTADRPWEAYDARSAQTVDQVKWYGDHVRHYAELGAPDPSPFALRAVARIAAQAVAYAAGAAPGPVHVNARFRRPLEPVTNDAPYAWESIAEEVFASSPRVLRAAARGGDDVARAIAELVQDARSGVLVCGPAPASAASTRPRSAVSAFLRRSGFALFAEATSQMRFGLEPPPSVLGWFDAALRDPSMRKALAPDLVIEIGRPALSTGYAAWLNERRGMKRVVLDDHGWGDPNGGATAMVLADPYATLERVSVLVAERAPSPELSTVIAAGEARVGDRLAIESAGPLGEGDVARIVVDAMPDGGFLLAGNSSPVRDLDTFVAPCRKSITVLHQRGASGIDGFIAGSAGTRSVASGPVVALVGDVTFAHDVGSLPLVAGEERTLVIVVVNNGGGRIFEQLPIASRPEAAAHFERFFAARPSFDVLATARAFGVAGLRVETREALHQALDASLKRAGSTVIEVVVPPHDGARRRAALWR